MSQKKAHMLQFRLGPGSTQPWLGPVFAKADCSKLPLFIQSETLHELTPLSFSLNLSLSFRPPPPKKNSAVEIIASGSSGRDYVCFLQQIYFVP